MNKGQVEKLCANVGKKKNHKRINIKKAHAQTYERDFGTKDD